MGAGEGCADGRNGLIKESEEICWDRDDYIWFICTTELNKITNRIAHKLQKGKWSQQQKNTFLQASGKAQLVPQTQLSSLCMNLSALCLFILDRAVIWAAYSSRAVIYFLLFSAEDCFSSAAAGWVIQNGVLSPLMPYFSLRQIPLTFLLL